MWTWISNHRMPIAISLVLLVGIACASVACYLWLATPPPSVPEVTQTVATQQAVTTVITHVKAERETNDEAIKTAYEKARADAMALSADAVVVELNVLLTELRGGSIKP